QCGIDLFDDRAYQLPTAFIDPGTRQVRPALQAVRA
ncbi:MBL fold metallo-hydrolase, partial [Corallococcus coralloides]|nr:MBL fold metallo-hydrolase [Corallococcus coralloides]